MTVVHQVARTAGNDVRLVVIELRPGTGVTASHPETIVDLALAVVDALDQSRAHASSPPTTATTP